MSRDIEISVVVPTYNRGESLKRVIQSLLAQHACPTSHEVIVVDNNSTDRTRATVASLIEGSTVPLRYVFESKQGVSFARNAGIAAARGASIAFVDDDVTPAPEWLRTLHRALVEYPDAGFVGGKVLPIWETRPPEWLTRNHWMPLALIDYGDTPFMVNAANSVCLVSANLAVRRRTFETAGTFAPELQRVKDGVGSMEDHEFLARLFRQGIAGLYVPDLVVTTQVPIDRIQRSYHRRWHAGHGYHYALMQSAELEPPSATRVLGVPAYLYKQAATDAARVLSAWWSPPSERAVQCEMRLCFFAGFVRRRYADLARGHASYRHPSQGAAGGNGGLQ